MSSEVPTRPLKRIEYEPGTEGLRGFCALIVLYTHWLAPFNHVDPRYTPSPIFWWFEAGQGAVLLFFVLSGYVIGITNRHSFNGGAFRGYVRRRIIRLVPLYFVAVLFSHAVRPQDTWGTVLGNLAFLQNEIPLAHWHVPLLASNTNLWSLNYEVLYYGLFLFVWLKPRAWPIWLAVATVIGAFGWHIPGAGIAIATYAAGWMFWLAGFALAQAPKFAKSEVIRLPWPSILLLWLATWHLKPLWWFTHRFGLLPVGDSWMNFSFCDLIPASVALLMAASDRRPRSSALLVGATFAIPGGFTLWLAARGRFADPIVCVYCAMVVAAVLLWFWRPSTRWFAALAPVGMISYAIYIFQRPVQWLILDHAPLPVGTMLTFVIRVFVIAVLTFTVSYLGELQLQPRIRRFFSPKRTPARVVQPAAVG